MAKVISMRLSDTEEARVRTAAALSGLSTSAYLKRILLSLGEDHDQNATVLRRLDEIAIAIAKLGGSSRSAPAPVAPQNSDRTELVRGLKDRGIPTSTIRQVEAVLDELVKSRAKLG